MVISEKDIPISRQQVEPVSAHQAVQTLPATEDTAQQTTPDTRHMTAQTAADIGHLAIKTDRQLRIAVGESTSVTTEPARLLNQEEVIRKNKNIKDMFVASGEKLELEKKRLAELESKFKHEAEARLEALSVHSDRISALERKQVQLLGYIDDKEQGLQPSVSERVMPIGKSGSEESLTSVKSARKNVQKGGPSQQSPSPEVTGRQTTPPQSAHPCGSAEVSAQPPVAGASPSRAKTPPKFCTSAVAESVTARLYKTKSARKQEEMDSVARKKPTSKPKPVPCDHTIRSQSVPANKSSVSSDGPKSPSHGRLAIPATPRSFSAKLHLSSSNLASVPESSREFSDAPEELSSSLPELSQSLPTSQYFDMISEQPRCRSQVNLAWSPHGTTDSVPCWPSSSEVQMVRPVHPTLTVPYYMKSSQPHDLSMRKTKPDDASPLSYHVALKSLRGPSNSVSGRDRPTDKRCDKPASSVAKTRPTRKAALQAKGSVETPVSTRPAPRQWNVSTKPSIPTKVCKYDPAGLVVQSRGTQGSDCKEGTSKDLHSRTSDISGRTVNRQMSPRPAEGSPHSSGVSRQDKLVDYLSSSRVPPASAPVKVNQPVTGRRSENEPRMSIDITRTLVEADQWASDGQWSVDSLHTLYPSGAHSAHIESPDVIPRIAIPNFTSLSPLKTHRSEGDEVSVQSSIKRDSSPAKEHKQKRRRSADIPVEIYIPEGVPISSRGGHSSQQADDLFFDFTDSMQGLTGHVVMETPIGTPPGEMIVTDDWTKVIRRHGQKAAEQQDRTHVHHTPATVTARLTGKGTPFTAASSKHIWPRLADDYVSILDLKAEELRDSQLTCRQPTDHQHTVPPDRVTDQQCTRPVDHKYIVPTNHQHTVPNEHQYTMSTNHQHTMSTDHQHTMPNDHQHTMPIEPQHTTPTKHTLPTAHQHILPMDSQHTMTTGLQHTIPTHNQHTKATDHQHIVPTDNQHTIPTDDRHTMPTDHQQTVPTHNQHTTPTDSQHPMPTDHQHTAPTAHQRILPKDSQHTMTTGLQHTIPTHNQHTKATDHQHIVPTDHHKGVTTTEASSPGVDIGSPVVDIDSLSVDIGSPVVDIDSLRVDIGSPILAIGSPGVDIGSPGVDIGSPRVDIDSPVADIGSAIVDIGSAAQGELLLRASPGDTMVPGDNFTDDSLDEDVKNVITSVTSDGGDDRCCSQQPMTEPKSVSNPESLQATVCKRDTAAPQQRPHDESQQRPQVEPQQRLHEEPQQRPHDESQQRPQVEPQQRPQVEPQQRSHEEPQQKPNEEPQQRTVQVSQVPQQAPQQAPPHGTMELAPQQAAPHEPQVERLAFSDDSLNDNIEQKVSDTVLESRCHDHPAVTVTAGADMHPHHHATPGEDRANVDMTSTVLTPGAQTQMHNDSNEPFDTHGQTTMQPQVLLTVEVKMSSSMEVQTEDQPSTESR